MTERAKDIAERLRGGGYDGVTLLHASGPAARQSVSHFHLHLAPRRADDGYDLWPETDRWDGTNEAPCTTTSPRYWTDRGRRIRQV